MLHFETRDGVDIAYEACGHGVPVIVCHGGPSTTHEYLVDDLSALNDTAQLVFHDYRGSGQSATAAADSYNFERLADDVDEVRAHLGFERVTVLAHSLGGFVALHYALRHGERCERLVLISCSPAASMSRTAIPTLRALGPVRFARMLDKAARYLVWWTWKPDSEAKTLARYSAMSVLQEGGREWRAEVAKREVLADNDNAPTLERVAFKTDLCDQLHRIKCPVVVINGSRDAPFAAGAALLERGLPHVRRVTFEGVGHHPLVEEHARTIAEIRTALAEHA
jgi:proline iminopeptidase